MTVPTAPDQPSGSHDFDFFFGSWHIVNERLRSRLSGSSDWETNWIMHMTRLSEG